MTDRSPVAASPVPQDEAEVGAEAVVGIGASAGGLSALRLFFEQVPSRSGMAYVVIMHLDRERESRIAAILQDWTPLPVKQVTERTQVAADHVYVIAPDIDLEMRPDGTLEVVERGDASLHSPVDLFFGTLAEAYGANAVGVVLSGTGEDGTRGIRRIKECGGFTVAQAPDEAEHEGMPRSAIAGGQVDLTAAAAAIPGELVRMRTGPSPLGPDAPAAGVEAALAEVFQALHSRTGHDFSMYKRSTVLRRLERRLRFNGVKSLEEYVPLMRSEPESRALVRDLLISVSGFFRDPPAFEALSGVIPSLFEGKGPQDAVRVWVAGCATGEEAYSIAILLAEHAATLEEPARIQIFATDIDEKGYAVGREGFYAASAVANLPQPRLRRFFSQSGAGYRVAKPLREMVLFAVHNVLHDPAFSRLDLISCRNLLIYLQPEAQRQVLETFHYALRPNGVLFLGGSESIGESRLFVPVVRPHRIFRRDASPPVVPLRHLPAAGAAREAAPPARREAVGSAGFSFGPRHLRLLEAYGPPSLVVTERMEVVHLSANASQYLRQGAGPPTHNLLDLAPAGLRLELRAALHEAFEKGKPDTRWVRGDGERSVPLSLRVYPAEDGPDGKIALVVFDPQEPGVPEAESSEDAPRGDVVLRLEEELRRTREQLESTSAAHDAVVYELESANAELRSTNEEEKAAVEELETSREEIQSINEELTTINQEHQTTIEELKRTNADLENLIESSEIGTIFVDRELRIRRFTPSAATLFHFAATDRGRPLGHITHRLNYGALLQDAQTVLESRQRVEHEVSSHSGEWYIMRLSPYRSPEEGVDGVVLTFFNVTAQKRVEEALRAATLASDAANRAKAAFLATLSHEFRTPLNGILGYAELLQMDDSLNEVQKMKVVRIQACGHHLASRIDAVLTFAKLDEGLEPVHFESLDARSLAYQTRDVLEQAALTKGLAFELDLPDDEVLLETDASKARHILLNLCSNAVKYTPHGEVRLRMRAEDERVVFEVRDTGVGIAEEHLARVFERFWQVDGGSSRADGGVGIGLAAAREFGKLLGGDVEVESELGQGSTFRLWLPKSARGRSPHPLRRYGDQTAPAPRQDEDVGAIS